jgi:hypothetical protein
MGGDSFFSIFRSHKANAAGSLNHRSTDPPIFISHSGCSLALLRAAWTSRESHKQMYTSGTTRDQLLLLLALEMRC